MSNFTGFNDSGNSGVLAERLFIKSDGLPAIFTNTAARDAYFSGSPAELARVKNSPVGIGTANAVTAAYVYDKNASRWYPIAVNFKGDRGAAGLGVNDLSAIPDNHVVTVVGGKVVDSGVEASNKSIAADALFLGLEKVSSSGETLLITNLVEGVTRSPLYQAIAEGAQEGYVREIGGIQSLTSGGQTTRSTNPDLTFPITNNAVIFSAEFNFAAVMSNVSIKIYRGVFPKPIWDVNIGAVTVGKRTLSLKLDPLLLKGGLAYRITFDSPDGDVILKAGTNGRPYSSVQYSVWRDVPLATKEWVSQQIGGSPAHVPIPIIKDVTDVTLDAQDKLDILHSDGSITKLTLPKAASSVAVKNVSLTTGGDLLITYTDGTTSNIPVKGGQAKDATAFVYYDKVIPTYPTELKSNYFVSLYALKGLTELPAPTASTTIPDGTMFIVSNRDQVDSLKISGLSYGSSQFIGPASIAWFVYGKGGWTNVFIGYISTSFQGLYNDIKRQLLADKSFTPAAGEGVTLINPDGTEHKVDKLKLVGMEVRDPGDGTPLKLTLLDEHNNPHPSSTSAYAFFSANALAPPVLEVRSLPVYRGGRVSVHKDNTNGEYIYILLPPGEGDDVERIGELGGLPSLWSKSSKNYPVNGVARVYTVFRSPYKFHEQDVTLVLYP